MQNTNPDVNQQTTAFAKNAQSDSMPYAGFFVRTGAFLFDICFCFSSWFLIVHILYSISTAFLTPLFFNLSAGWVIGVICSCIYFVLLTYYKGATIGKLIFKLRVVNEEGKKPSFGTVLYRETVGRILSALFFAGYIMAGLDDRKRGLHDMLSDTYVVYKKPQIMPRPVQPISIRKEPQVSESSLREEKAVHEETDAVIQGTSGNHSL